jgi:hypothetical protein
MLPPRSIAPEKMFSRPPLPITVPLALPPRRKAAALDAGLTDSPAGKSDFRSAAADDVEVRRHARRDEERRVRGGDRVADGHGSGSPGWRPTANMRAAMTCRWQAAASQSSFSRTVRSRSHAKTHTPRTERSDVQMQARREGLWGAQMSGNPQRSARPQATRYGGVSGNENPPACNACRRCSLTVSEAVAARQQANASRRRAAAACRASYVTCRCAISRRCAVGASTSSGAAAATSTPASILPGRKISDAIHYLATLLIAPASVMDLFFLQKARTLAVFVSRRLKSRISLLAAAL